MFRFGGVGVLNTMVGLSIIWGLMYLGVGPFKANFTGYAVGIVMSFLLNRSWTFRDQASGWPFARYILAVAIAYGANLVALGVALRVSGQAAYMSQLVAAIIYSGALFLLCRHLVFTK